MDIGTPVRLQILDLIGAATVRPGAVGNARTFPVGTLYVAFKAPGSPVRFILLREFAGQIRRTSLKGVGINSRLAGDSCANAQMAVVLPDYIGFISRAGDV